MQLCQHLQRLQAVETGHRVVQHELPDQGVHLRQAVRRPGSSGRIQSASGPPRVMEPKTRSKAAKTKQNLWAEKAEAPIFLS